MPRVISFNPKFPLPEIPPRGRSPRDLRHRRLRRHQQRGQGQGAGRRAPQEREDGHLQHQPE